MVTLHEVLTCISAHISSITQYNLSKRKMKNTSWTIHFFH